MIRSTLVLLLLLTGCAAGQTPGSSPPSPAKGDPVPVTVEKTGGIAGVTETIKIDESGKWTKGQASGRLTVEKSQQLQELAANPKLAAEATQTRPQTQCRDAFEYSVTAGKTTVRYVDCSTDGPLPETASKIVELINEAIS